VRRSGQHRSTQRKVPRRREDTERLTADVIDLARQYGPLWLSQDRRPAAPGGLVGERRPGGAGLAARGAEGASEAAETRAPVADRGVLHPSAAGANHVWSYDFVEDRTHDGRKYRILNVLDEFTHECLAIRVNRKLKAIDVIDALSDLFMLRGVPYPLR
jgi:putative transposase